MLDVIAPRQTHAEVAGFVPAYPCAATLPPVAFGTHARIATLSNSRVGLALFPLEPDRVLLVISAPGVETVIHLSAATVQSLATVAAAVAALCQVDQTSDDGEVAHDAAGLAVGLVGTEAKQPPLRPVSQRA